MQSHKQSNIKEPLLLDALEDNWSTRFANYDFIILINLLHLISWKEVKEAVKGIAEALNCGGFALVYGPFTRSGQLTSVNDRVFNNELVKSDPVIGNKDDLAIIGLCNLVGLKHKETVQMPANNISFVLKK